MVRSIVACGIGVAVGAVISSLWVWAVPHYRAGLDDKEIYGLDVSHHQGVVDWDLVADDEIDFVYLKATEGSDFVDSRFEQNLAGTQAAGLRVGAYHFFTLCSSGTTQAEHFLDTVNKAAAQSRQPELPLAIDLEFGGNCSESNRLPDLDAEVSDFLNIVEAATGEPLLVYRLEGFEGTNAVPSLSQPSLTTGASRPRWVRSLFRRPGTDWLVWQFHHRGAVNGVDGPVDINVGSSAL